MVASAVDDRLSSVHHDVLQSHILTRLDGPTLASAACASSDLNALSTDDNLWRKICSSTWPSIDDPRVRSAISAFPSGHRSFFSDSYPLIHQRCRRQRKQIPATKRFISAVDIYYKDIPVLSKVVETETVTGWFLCSPFRVDLLEPKEYVRTWIRQVAGDQSSWVKEVEENLTLSWILIDPDQKRAVNLSSLKPVSVEKHWLTGEVQAKFAAVMGGDGGKGSATEHVQCQMVVTCGGKEGGEVNVRDVSMGIEDMEGKSVCGKDSLVILQGAMEGERRKGKGGKEGKEKFGEFMEMKKERKEKMARKEKILDMACIITGFTIFVTFWCFILSR